LITIDLKLLFNTVGVIQRNVGETPIRTISQSTLCEIVLIPPFGGVGQKHPVNNIQEYNNKITNSDSNFIKLNEIKLGKLKNNIRKFESNIHEIDQATIIIKNGVKALHNKEIKDLQDKEVIKFYKEYKAQFPQAKYLKYHEMKTIKAANKLMGRPVSIEEIKSNRDMRGHKIEKIDSEILNTKDNNKKIELKADRIKISTEFTVLSDAIKCLNNAIRSSKVQQHYHDDLKLTKAFKGRDYEEEM